MTRSRPAGLSRDEARLRPLYARVLGLRHLAPSGFLCFVFLEGSVALGILLALAELVSWWGVLVLPALVAVMVKLNDVVAGMLIRPPVSRPVAVSGSLAGSAGAETVRLSPAMIAKATSGPAADAAARSGAAGFRRTGPDIESAGLGRTGPDMGSAGLGRTGPDTGTAGPRRMSPDLGPAGEERWTPSVIGGIDASALNGPPVTRQWTEDLDDQQQRARQSAARRYQ